MLPKTLSVAFSNAASKVLNDNQPFRYSPISLEESGEGGAVSLLVESFQPSTSDQTFLLVYIEQVEKGPDIEQSAFGLKESLQRITDLEEEARYNRSRLKSAVEELEASNEELQTSNEELQASNEELQSTNEELESVNEELQTLNFDYQNKITELTNANEDLDNFIVSTGIATIFLDLDLCVRRFTPTAAEKTGLLTGDVGRKITELAHPLLVTAAEAARSILDGAKKIESSISGLNSETLLMRATPFIRKDGDRTGVIVSFIPINHS
jgi:two-component system CheB/CheR fusion protein